MIQIITNDTLWYKGKFTSQEIVISSFHNYKSFDLYDVNIINLSSNSLWESNSMNGEYLNDYSDIIMVKNSINTSTSKVVIFFPQNHLFKYDYSRVDKKHKKSVQLKNVQITIKDFLTKYIYEPLPKFAYDKGITKIAGEVYDSDFYFKESNGLICCEKSKRNNTMSLKNNIVITTLNIFETPVNKEIEKRLYMFLDKIKFVKKSEVIPEWVENIHFFDDSVYKDSIDKCNNEIERLKGVIAENEEKLNVNLSYKSILYSSGHPLAEQINKMLIKIFDLESDFVDVCEEDFNFKMNGTTFIVETKGLNNEVSGQNISDASNHLIIYDDKLEKSNIVEDTKCLFFVATERNKFPEERAKIKERQITIAQGNKTLIIETPTFYKLFEDFMKNEISSDEILKMFKQQNGLLEYKNNKTEI